MRIKSVRKIVVAGVLAVGSLAIASISPALAAKYYTHTPKPCAKPELRCIADCDKEHWCRVYACSANETIVLPFHCNEDSGLCFAPHC
jgi:hypothetical protein